ncbi:MAG: RES family NAD+ phosphorylase [Legionellales bacterium]|nr:RES family NAD+ phosphorylase [Legionellales bacterium]
MKNPSLIDLSGTKHFRIIPSLYPPINFFEKLVDASEMELLWEIEGLTNERLLEETGDIFLVKKEDRICGKGSSVVMAAFTHIHKKSRFTDGKYGIYYAGLNRETALRETIYHREKFLQATAEKACEITMRCYKGKITKPLHDIRAKKYQSLHDPHSYTVSQEFASKMRAQNSWGLIYNSVRHPQSNCIALFRPPATTIPIQTDHLSYVWDGTKITSVYQKTEPLLIL